MAQRRKRAATVKAAIIIGVCTIIAAAIPVLFSLLRHEAPPVDRAIGEYQKGASDDPVLDKAAKDTDEKDSGTDAARLETLFVLAGNTTQEARWNAAFALVLRELIITRARGASVVDEDSVYSRVVAAGARISPPDFQELLDEIDASKTSDPAWGLLSRTDGSSQALVNVDTFSKWLLSENGRRVLETLDFPAPTPMVSGDHSQDTGDPDQLFLQAKDMLATLKEAEKLPGGAERTSIMTHALRNAWDVKKIMYLARYLEQDPDGVHADEARALLDEAKQYKLLKSMGLLRPELEEVWEKIEQSKKPQ